MAKRHGEHANANSGSTLDPTSCTLMPHLYTTSAAPEPMTALGSLESMGTHRSACAYICARSVSSTFNRFAVDSTALALSSSCTPVVKLRLEIFDCRLLNIMCVLSLIDMPGACMRDN